MVVSVRNAAVGGWVGGMCGAECDERVVGPHAEVWVSSLQENADSGSLWRWV